MGKSDWSILKVVDVNGNDVTFDNDETHYIDHNCFFVGSIVGFNGRRYVLLEQDYSSFMAFYEVQKLSTNTYVYWHVVPVDFWEDNGYIPDWDLNMEIPDMIECQEHCYEVIREWGLNKQKAHMQKLGFQIAQLP